MCSSDLLRNFSETISASVRPKAKIGLTRCTPLHFLRGRRKDVQDLDRNLHHFIGHLRGQRDILRSKLGARGDILLDKLSAVATPLRDWNELAVRCS